MELKDGKEYFSKKDEHVWTFTGWIPDRDNPGKKKACFSRIEKQNRFIPEDEIDGDLEA